MASNIKQFGARIRRSSKLADKAVLEWQRRVTMAALTSVVVKTPVDTGRARANWQAGGQPNELSIDTVDPSGSSALASGGSALRALSKPYGVMWVWNNVHYIKYLEEGSSRQAPNGMVAVTRAELRAEAGGFRFVGGLFIDPDLG